MNCSLGAVSASDYHTGLFDIRKLGKTRVQVAIRMPTEVTN